MSYQPGQEPNQQGQYPGTGQQYGAGYTPPQPQPTDPYSGQQYGQQPGAQPGGYQPPYGQQPYGQQAPYGQQQYQQPYSATGTTLGMQPNIAAALSYVFGWISGLVIFLLEKQNREVRFHAMQSIIFFGAINILQVLSGFLLFFIAPLVGWVLWVLLVVGWIVLVINAYQGNHFKLPLIGDYAERYADQIKL